MGILKSIAVGVIVNIATEGITNTLRQANNIGDIANLYFDAVDIAKDIKAEIIDPVVRQVRGDEVLEPVCFEDILFEDVDENPISHKSTFIDITPPPTITVIPASDKDDSALIDSAITKIEEAYGVTMGSLQFATVKWCLQMLQCGHTSTVVVGINKNDEYIAATAHSFEAMNMSFKDDTALIIRYSNLAGFNISVSTADYAIAVALA